MSVGGTLAAVVTFFVTGGNFQAAAAAYALGSTAEALLNPPTNQGPRLDDLRVQQNNYGASIPFEWGINRHAGTAIWPRELVLDEHEGDTFTYTATFAVLICEGPIAGVRRIWANKKLVYDVSGASTETKDPALRGLRIYLGTETQEPDPTIEAADGPSPAYLGYAYAVFEDYELTDAGNRPPSFEFEVVTNTDTEAPEVSVTNINGDTTISGKSALDPITGFVYVVDDGTVYVYDPAQTSGIPVDVITLPNTGPFHGPDAITYWPVGNQMIVGNGAPSFGSTMGWIIDCGPRVANPSFYGDASAYFWPGIPADGGTLFFGSNGLGGSVVFDTLKLNDHGSLGDFSWSLPSYGWNVMRSPDGVDEVIMCVNRQIVWNIYRIEGSGETPSFPGNQIANLDWPEFPFSGGHMIQFDDARGVFYWANDSRDGVYCIKREPPIMDQGAPRFGLIYKCVDLPAIRSIFYDPDADVLYVATGAGFDYEFYSFQPNEWPEGDTLGGFNGISENTPEGDAYEDGTARPAWNASLHFEQLEGPFTNGGTSAINNGGARQAFYLGNGKFSYSAVGQVLVVDFGPGTLDPHPVLLKDIVRDICVRAELATTDIDVEQLTDLVDGYIVPRQMTARAAIEPLQKAYFFDAVESDNKLKFVKRGGEIAATIPIIDRAAHEYGADIPENLAIVRAQDLELPVQFDVEYPDIDADHLTGNQYDRRITKDTRHKENLQLAIVMNAAKAKQIAIVNLYQAWQNVSFRFTTTRKYSYLEPTDIVALPTNEVSYFARITGKRERPGGVIEWDAAIEALEIYSQAGDGAAPTNYVPQEVSSSPGMTLLKLLDVPLMRDADNNGGFYIAMNGTGDGWRGAQLYESTDGGTNYDSLLSVSTAASMGTAAGALPDFGGGNTFDESGTVSVVMRAGMTLTSATELQVVNGANMAVLGAPGRWEVIQFKNATLTGTNTYLLSGLLRGRRGTEWATGTHGAGDAFILFNSAAWERIDDADIGLARLYKAPPFRTSLSSAAAQSFTDTAVGLKPFAPVLLGGGFGESGDASLSWTRRSRLTGEWRDNVDVSLGEESEAYQVEIWDADFETLKRTISVSAATSATYSAADQTTDFGAPQSVVYFRVYQISALVGRGYGAQGTAPASDTTFI